jgi:hypothetical protein
LQWAAPRVYPTHDGIDVNQDNTSNTAIAVPKRGLDSRSKERAR